jgi:hypothetical protein
MSGATIVMVYDPDDERHGEITVAEGPKQAAQIVESLLEAGFDQARIRVFQGSEMDMQVRHRPVVALIDGDSVEGEPPPEQAAGNEPRETREPEEAIPRAKAELVEVGAAPFVKDGVRFSSLFRPA